MASRENRKRKVVDKLAKEYCHIAKKKEMERIKSFYFYRVIYYPAVFYYAILFQVVRIMLVNIYLYKNRNKKRGFQRSLLIDLLLPINVAKDAQASLEDAWVVWVAFHGVRKATIIHRYQTVRLVVGHHLIPVINYLERFLRTVRGMNPTD